MIGQPGSVNGRILVLGSAVFLGLGVAAITAVALTMLKPEVVALGFCGLVVLLPTFVVADPKSYWLFLLFFAMPFDIGKRITTGIISPWTLLENYGLPPVETLSVDLYPTDVVLFALLFPWLARICLHREKLYFPRISSVFLLYSAYTIIIGAFVSVSFYLTLFEWARELLHFVSFLYIVNNVVSRANFRAVFIALMAGLALESAVVVIQFERGVGTEKPLFSAFYSNTAKDMKFDEHTHYAGEGGDGLKIKRSAGTFGHPALTAYYIEFILPIALGALLTAANTRERMLYGGVFGTGFIGLILTFARSGLIGTIAALFAFFWVARWARMISRRKFEFYIFTFVASIALSAPLVIMDLKSRPEAALFRLTLLQTGFEQFWDSPIVGSGLNNATALMKVDLPRSIGGTKNFIKLHNYYLVVLVETGVIGFGLYYTFFGLVAWTAIRSMRAVNNELKMLLVGIVSAFVGITVHNNGDPFQGHAPSAMLWFYSALAVGINRRTRQWTASSAPLAPSANLFPNKGLSPPITP